MASAAYTDLQMAKALLLSSPQGELGIRGLFNAMILSSCIKFPGIAGWNEKEEPLPCPDSSETLAYKAGNAPTGNAVD
ncbi:hypothetical protein MKX08_004551 [Trichoderma sp. CBMAI-0020]|nr:hypothetical protein MKX08_004551 [Trichoderma sp. CBMAI-0020]